VATWRATAVTVVAVLSATGAFARAQTSGSWLDPYRGTAQKLMTAAQENDFAWRRLAELTDTYGARPAWSENLTRAIAWAVETMKADGLDNVRAERVMVPKWVRGVESAEIVDPPRHPIAMLGLGGTVATPPGGIEADVLVVTSFDDLRAKRTHVPGRIVLFDVPFTAYSETMSYRTGGARLAAEYGAAAVLVRSVGPIGLRTPHTGSVNYVAGQPQIPAAAIAAEDANRIGRLSAAGRRVRVRLVTSGRTEAETPSANVIGEIVGRERPEEVVLVGGHLDSWDVGTGASDDGAGCIITWEALRLMKKLGIRPRRTVRLVLWTNEEHGMRGATAYYANYVHQAANHVLAIESDSGVFAPASLGFSGSAAGRMVMAQIAGLLAPLGLQDIGAGGGGPDIDPIAQAGNVPALAYLGDASRLFTIHHTAADTVERIAPEELSKAAAAMAVITYVAAEMPERIPK
jgi:carboxypeptidase Q